MSATPRADDECVEIWAEHYIVAPMPKDGQFVRSEFARTLETELAAVTKQRDELAAALHDILNDAPDSPLWKIKAAVAALKSIEDTNQ